jgi:ribosome-associated toxin RatA of RatAB toxin-antitoxin module
MHTVERSVLVPHSASQMFNLVADVQKYPEFMPWCGGASVALSLVKGPFSALDGEWKFMPLADNACKVLFTLRYEFSSRALEVVVGPVFNRIATSFIDSFTQRAAQYYGDGS